jgi:protocatechuate 3,4-dioxygenase beta subunit
MHGRILDATTQQPLANVSIDVWQASTNGQTQSTFVSKSTGKLAK